MNTKTAWRIAIVGAGPAGLALALLAAKLLPFAHITLFDARAADRDVAADPRTLALSQGSVMLLQRLGVWAGIAEKHAAEPITTVHVSQATPSVFDHTWGSPAVELHAAALGVPQLGAVLSFGSLLAPLQAAWMQHAATEPLRLHTRFGSAVSTLVNRDAGVELTTEGSGSPEYFDLAVIAEGGVFGEQATKPVRHDYAQTAWVGSVVQQGATRGMAFERFTRHGPAALLPLPPASDAADAARRSALVWCVASKDDPVRDLDDAQRLAVLNTIFPPTAGQLIAISPLKSFALGLNAERTLVDGRRVRIGNAAQTLHPVAGQGLNLGLRDVHALVSALRRAEGGDIDAALKRVEWQRAPDRWSTIATTDFLARSFTWDLPGATAARAIGLAAVGAAPPMKAWLARRMMFGVR